MVVGPRNRPESFFLVRLSPACIQVRDFFALTSHGLRLGLIHRNAYLVQQRIDSRICAIEFADVLARLPTDGGTIEPSNIAGAHPLDQSPLSAVHQTLQRYICPIRQPEFICATTGRLICKSN